MLLLYSTVYGNMIPIIKGTLFHSKKFHKVVLGKNQGLWIRIRIIFGRWIHIHIKSEFRSLEAQNGAVEDSGRSQWRRGGSKWSPEGSVHQ